MILPAISVPAKAGTDAPDSRRPPSIILSPGDSVPQNIEMLRYIPHEGAPAQKDLRYADATARGSSDRPEDTVARSYAKLPIEEAGASLRGREVFVKRVTCRLYRCCGR